MMLKVCGFGAPQARRLSARKIIQLDQAEYRVRRKEIEGKPASQFSCELLEVSAIMIDRRARARGKSSLDHDDGDDEQTSRRLSPQCKQCKIHWQGGHCVVFLAT